jgi:hypothetical protein
VSPLEYIEAGILEGNWEMVLEGYERLTGKGLPYPRSTKATDAEEAVQKILQIVMCFTQNTTPQSTKKTPVKQSGKIKKKRLKTTTVTEDGEDASVQIDESQKTPEQKECGGTRFITNDPDEEEIITNRIKAKKARKNKQQLQRESTAIKHMVQCNECGNEFPSIRAGGEIGQKCPKCLRDKKSRLA